MRNAALLATAIILAGCSGQDLARSAVAAGAGYAIGRHVERNADEGDPREIYRTYCRGDRFDESDCYPRRSR